MNGLAPSYLAELVKPRKRDGLLRQNYAPTVDRANTAPRHDKEMSKNFFK